MTKFELIDKILEKNNGYLTISNVVKDNISKPTIYNYLQKNNFEQVARGIYVSSDTWIDDLYLLHLRYKQAIFSHETALFLHDLIDREPIKYAITLKAGYNSPQLKATDIDVYNVKKELFNIGLSNVITSFGNTVPVYNMERTICDILKKRNYIEKEIIISSLKVYVKKKDKNLGQLMKYAEMFRVVKILKPYLEVLL